MDTAFTRRRLLAFLPPVVATAVLAACGGKDDASRKDAASARSNASAPANPSSASRSGQLKATPACGDADDVTPEQTEGPYFTRNSPERTSLLENGAGGTKLVLTGVVLDRS